MAALPRYVDHNPQAVLVGEYTLQVVGCKYPEHQDAAINVAVGQQVRIVPFEAEWYEFGVPKTDPDAVKAVTLGQQQVGVLLSKEAHRFTNVLDSCGPLSVVAKVRSKWPTVYYGTRCIGSIKLTAAIYVADEVARQTVQQAMFDAGFRLYVA